MVVHSKDFPLGLTNAEYASLTAAKLEEAVRQEQRARDDVMMRHGWTETARSEARAAPDDKDLRGRLAAHSRGLAEAEKLWEEAKERTQAARLAYNVFNPPASKPTTPQG